MYKDLNYSFVKIAFYHFFASTFLKTRLKVNKLNLWSFTKLLSINGENY